ncbi:MAG: hypothetical protein ACXWQO_15425 [Bdellovibrionota bacterium]
MIDISKQKVIFLRRTGEAESLFQNFETTAQKISDYQAFEAQTFTTFANFAAEHLAANPSATLFLDLVWIEEAKITFEPAWKDWNVVLVKTMPPSEQVMPWLKSFSCLDISALDDFGLTKSVQLAVAAEKMPGIVSLCESGTEIYFEKLTSMSGIGKKLDRFLALLENKYPQLTNQLFNLRQLTYALVHQALATSAATSKIIPVVDFQIAAGPERIAFSTRFNAAPQTLERWQAEMAEGKNQILFNASLCADLLSLTEITDLNQIEVKALLAGGGEFSAASRRSVLARSVANFLPDSAVLEAQKHAKFQPLFVLEAGEKAELAEVAAGAEEAGGTEIQSKAGMGTQLNFKLKSDMLETEKGNLQGLVKKKSQLINDLTKDVNRAQREVVETQKNATKEILKMRMETEKAKNEARDAKKKLIAFQRKAAEAAEAESKAKLADAAPKQDFEKDWKQAEFARRNLEAQLKEQADKAGKADELLQKVRKEMGQLTGENNLLKQKLLQQTQKAVAGAGNGDGKKSAAEEALEKLKASQKLYAEARGREQELEKAVKSLALKLDAAEKNSKAGGATFSKQVEAAERAAEEAKRQRSEILAKLEEAKADAKKKVEEGNERERALRKQIDEQKAKLDQLSPEAAPLVKKAS